MLAISWDNLLVTLSFIVAFVASFTALDIAGRVSRSRGRRAVCWLIGGGTAMGIGIWSMHFIGMLAMILPMSMHYDLPLTLGSMSVAIVASILALRQVCIDELPLKRLITGALILGCGVVTMHYSGMMALMIMPAIQWDLPLVGLSILVAILASGSALWLAFQLRRGEKGLLMRRVMAAIVMGIAIAGMHYIGMDAARFPANIHMAAAGLSDHRLAIWVATITLSILALTLLISMLDAQIRAARLASRLAQANQELQHLALHDNLTHLPNRIQLEKQLDQAIKLATLNDRRFALMYMDLDGFKAVNDAYGHHIGDRLLIAVAQRLLSKLSRNHTLARLGGDEFVLLIDIDNREQASRLAEELVNVIDTPYKMECYEMTVSLSIGIALFPFDGKEKHELMLNADAAMYHTKHGGRNGWNFFEPKMNMVAQHQLQLTNDLWSALERDELHLFYQPKFSTPSGALLGFEALLRWQHPDRGLLMPDAFLSRAEKTGLIVSIGNWVINEACRQLQGWHQQGNSKWTVSVNLSALQFEQRDLVFTVQRALLRYQIPATLLTLEVTEAIAMRDPEISQRIIAALSDLGVKVSIDNFGIGYANLLHLKQLAASELKIDRSFINKLKAGSDDTHVLTAIVALAQTLNLRMVAEGVETAEQQQFLTRLGFDTLQGYLLGKPMPAERVSEYQPFSERNESPEIPLQHPFASA